MNQEPTHVDSFISNFLFTVPGQRVFQHNRTDIVDKVANDLGEAARTGVGQGRLLRAAAAIDGAASGHQARSRDACDRRVWWRPPDADRKCLEVLHDCGKVELVARPREASQPHALEAMMGLEVREPHFDFLPLIPRLLVLWRAIERTGVVARLLVDVTCDLPERCARALSLEFASAALCGL